MISRAEAEPPPIFRRWPRWKTAGLIFLIWTVVALMSGLQAHQNMLVMQQDWPVSGVSYFIFWTMRPSYTWALLTPVIWWLVRRFPPSQPRSFFLVQTGAMLACVVLQTVGRAVASVLIESPTMSFGTIVWAGLRLYFYTLATAYVVTAGVLVALETFRRLAEEQAQSARIRADAVEARLSAIQAQLQPHFLFNTLHAISTLVTESPPRAVEMIARLGDLLRDSLQRAGKAETRLHEELEFAEGYLAIEQVRLGDRLRLEWEVAPETRDLLVPRFVLQPLVENAIRHGVARSLAPGFVRIRTALEAEGQRLRIEVENSAPREPAGELPPAEANGGLRVSLANLRERLGVLYRAEQFSFSLNVRAESGGAQAVVLLPARLADETDLEPRPPAPAPATDGWSVAPLPAPAASRPC